MGLRARLTIVHSVRNGVDGGPKLDAMTQLEKLGCRAQCVYRAEDS